MINVQSNFIDQYIAAVGSAMNGFVPLIAATIGIFLAFAIANQMRFLIHKAAKKS